MAKSGLASRDHPDHGGGRHALEGVRGGAAGQGPLELDRLIHERMRLAIVSALAVNQSLSFNELKRQIEGISQRMLTLTLRSLERDGLLTRTIYPTIPPRVDYELTPLGRSLIGPVSALAEWAQTHIAEIDSARQRFDRKAGKPSLMKTLLGAAQR